MREQFWFNNPEILLNNYCVFFPNKDYSLTKNLNAIVRLFLYYTLLCFILTDGQLIDIIKPLLLICLLTVVVYNTYNKETFENSTIETIIRKSTNNNPMMNLLVSDYNNNKNIKIDTNITNEELNSNLVEDIPYNVDGGSNQKLLERSFYTMPVTNVYNEQTEFAKWLYDTGPTCKENTIMCYNSLPDVLQMGRGATKSSSS